MQNSYRNSVYCCCGWISDQFCNFQFGTECVGSSKKFYGAGELYKFWQKLGADYYSEPKIVLSNKLIESLHSLSVNPWSSRICFTFSSLHDPLSGLCSLNFDDLLSMISAFHFRTPIEIKYFWAFKLYDFDNDNLISYTDCHKCVRIIVGPTMSDREINQIVIKVFNETDLDGDKALTVGEFAAVMRRFHHSFHRKFSIKIF